MFRFIENDIQYVCIKRGAHVIMWAVNRCHGVNAVTQWKVMVEKQQIKFAARQTECSTQFCVICCVSRGDVGEITSYRRRYKSTLETTTRGRFRFISNGGCGTKVWTEKLNAYHCVFVKKCTHVQSFETLNLEEEIYICVKFSLFVPPMFPFYIEKILRTLDKSQDQFHELKHIWNI